MFSYQAALLRADVLGISLEKQVTFLVIPTFFVLTSVKKPVTCLRSAQSNGRGEGVRQLRPQDEGESSLGRKIEREWGSIREIMSNKKTILVTWQ